MDKNKREVIELILDELKKLEIISFGITDLLGVEYTGEGGLESTFSIGFTGIPAILDVEETDFLDNLFYGYIKQRISKKQYFKSLEKYLKEME